MAGELVKHTARPADPRGACPSYDACQLDFLESMGEHLKPINDRLSAIETNIATLVRRLPDASDGRPAQDTIDVDLPGHAKIRGASTRLAALVFVTVVAIGATAWVAHARVVSRAAPTTGATK